MNGNYYRRAGEDFRIVVEILPNNRLQGKEVTDTIWYWSDQSATLVDCRRVCPLL